MDGNIPTSGRGAQSLFGPLKFPDISSKSTLKSFAFDGDCSVHCLLCNSEFTLPVQKNEFLLHLFKVHKLVIADVDNIACLKSYIDYWRARVLVRPLAHFCTRCCVLVQCVANKESVEYFLLSDIVPEDKLLREGLQRKRLEWILDIQAKERETPISRSCTLCRWQFHGPRADFFSHLRVKHNLNLGCPQNLVFTDELLDVVENMMEKLQCIYCEGYFNERNIMKEHMRKKQHKRVNPNNKFFDHFYVINYLEMGKNWQQVQDEHDETDRDESERSSWSDWEDEDVEPQIVCLYCAYRRSSFEEVLDHMFKGHGLQFQESCSSLQLNFYQQVKLVNYIRRQMYEMTCPNCEEPFSAKEELHRHMTEKQHFRFPETKLWDQPEFYFPTYENDSFLCHLDDDEDSTDTDTDTDVLPDFSNLILPS